MFTGLITEVGRVEAARPIEGGIELRIVAERTAPRLAVGASVAVNGVCLTVTARTPPAFTVQAVGATMSATTFGALPDWAEASVNLEPSLRAGDELGGHLVSGHVDGIGTVAALDHQGEAVFLSLDLPVALGRYVARRGSIAVDGVSLTVANLDDRPDACRVVISVIPHTWMVTILSEYRPGRPVNIEVDTVARYLERLLPTGRSS